ncbi:hypothetical protein GCM10008938_28010 [Deinococcus roseus]|uniref:DUF1294 domain-containing protein n=2 Tax=Deinococcus roseus TaxID=392414 RepID=A0ABQ2D2H2_9DEIO|nr:hypothetical protein GCM10008938_28010 [Deinococcus roseus]
MAALYVLMGGVTFLVYGSDKRRARLGRRRVPERTLHLLELCFGWFGAFVAQRVVRHKTQKMPFQMVFWGIGLLHVLLVGLLAWGMQVS